MEQPASAHRGPEEGFAICALQLGCVGCHLVESHSCRNYDWGLGTDLERCYRFRIPFHVARYLTTISAENGFELCVSVTTPRCSNGDSWSEIRCQTRVVVYWSMTKVAVLVG